MKQSNKPREITEVSDDFIKSQRDYYKRHLRCGHPRDWELIAALFRAYDAECRERGL